MVPIALFVYNRPKHTLQTLKALATNNGASETTLYIFADGAKSQEDALNVASVKEVIKNTSGFKEVITIERASNIGLAQNIISGVTEVLSSHDNIIVLEDDLVTSVGFINYMNKALQFYANKEVFSICGYHPPINLPKNYPYSTYLAHRNGSWGWATWKNRWEKVDWSVSDFKQFIKDASARQKFALAGNDLPMMLLKQQQKFISSWSIRFCYAAFKLGMPTVYPCQSMIANQGIDGTGTHMAKSSKYNVTLALKIDEQQFCNDTTFDKSILDTFRKFYSTSLYRKLINQIKISHFLLFSGR